MFSHLVLSWRYAVAISGFDRSFDCAVAEREYERADVQRPVAARGHDDCGACQVTRDCEPQRDAKADAIDEQTQQHDADRERPQADAEQLTFLRRRQAELVTPVVDHERAQHEAERRRDQRRETGDEQGVALAAPSSACELIVPPRVVLRFTDPPRPRSRRLDSTAACTNCTPRNPSFAVGTSSAPAVRRRSSHHTPRSRSAMSRYTCANASR